jgi:putative pyruvate formate lyase activating enzyme
MQCTLCPRACRAERNESTGNGFCQLPTTMRIARIAPHLWEEPPISGKNGTGAVFFSGCTLRCAYCQNADISHRNAGRPFTPRELADSLRRLEDMGMHTISFITATPYVPQILETLDIYRPHVPLVWNTSGYETVETLRMLDGVMDVYLPDLKHRSEKMGQLCAKASNYFAPRWCARQERLSTMRTAS